MHPTFIHLRLHSEFSLIDGLIRMDSLMQRAVELGMPAIALTDHVNGYGWIKFYQAAIAAGIKPIIGSDIWVAADEAHPQMSQLCLLAQTHQGYHHLMQLISRAYQESQQQGKALIQRSWLANLSEGLIALSAGKDGDIGQALLANHADDAVQYLQHWQALFPDRFYIELQRTGREHEEHYLQAAVSLAADHGCPVVASNHVCFLHPEEFEAHEARVCINDGYTLNDERRPRYYSEQQYLRSPEDMAALFADIPEALANTVEIAKRCNVEIVLGKHYLPEYPIPETMTQETFFRQVSHDGLTKRLHAQFDSSASDFSATEQRYRQRLDRELDIILEMGFSGYFLIVMDFVQWAKKQGIPVGPGRGSGAGSLVAYAQCITDLDPLQYDLLFERFLNPERVSMPDFDIDFCMEGRDRVLGYVTQTYGREAVGQIATFSTMAAKGVVRDVARVQGKSYGLGDRLSKMIPFALDMTLAKAYQQEKLLQECLANDDQMQEVWDMAQQLEGLTRNVGKHAGGVVIAPTSLTDFAPLYCDDEGSGVMAQFDKNDVEAVGLVKFDFLGLRTLTIIDWAVSMVNEAKADTEPDLTIVDIPLDDHKTYYSLKKAQTTAVFQLESRGMRELIKRLKPDVFEDLIALVALFRPGPLDSGMVDDFVDRKHGHAVVAYPDANYQHTSLEPILAPTYGVIVYQEQVMQIAQVLAGYTLGEADILRRAMGKKQPEEMVKQRTVFAEGAQAKGVDPRLATKIFDLVEKFAGYGFNKSHSAAYALIAYQTAWLKTHYPAEFMAATLSSELHNTDKILLLIEECRALELVMRAPNINEGFYKFAPYSNHALSYGLGALKGIGENVVDAIVRERDKGGAFRDLFDFCERLDSHAINKRALETLIRAGAFDHLQEDRSLLMAAMPDAIKAASQSAANRESGMGDLFGATVVDESDCYLKFRDIKPQRERERLLDEKEALGFYFSGHPMDAYQAEVRQWAAHKIADIQASSQPQTLAGMLTSIRTLRNKRGETMAILILDDHSTSIEVTLFSDIFEQCRDQLMIDNILIVQGVVSVDDYSGGIRMRASSNGLKTLLEARKSSIHALELLLTAEDFSADFTQRLQQLLATNLSGRCPVVVHYRRDNVTVPVALGEQWRVQPSDTLIDHLRDWLGHDRVILRYGDTL